MSASQTRVCFKVPAVQLLHFERCTYISLVYTAFQELTEWEFHIPTGNCCTAKAGKPLGAAIEPPRGFSWFRFWAKRSGDHLIVYSNGSAFAIYEKIIGIQYGGRYTTGRYGIDPYGVGGEIHPPCSTAGDRRFSAIYFRFAKMRYTPSPRDIFPFRKNAICET